MEIKFNGDFTVKKTPQEVYDFWWTRTGFARCCRITRAWRFWTQEFLVKLSVGISHIRGPRRSRCRWWKRSERLARFTKGRATCRAGRRAYALGLICNRRRAERPRWFGLGNRMWLVELLRWRADAGAAGKKERAEID